MGIERGVCRERTVALIPSECAILAVEQTVQSSGETVTKSYEHLFSAGQERKCCSYFADFVPLRAE